MKQRSGNSGGSTRRRGINKEEEEGGERQSLLLSGTAYCDHYGGSGEATASVGNDSKLVAINNVVANNNDGDYDKYEVSGGGGGLTPIIVKSYYKARLSSWHCFRWVDCSIRTIKLKCNYHTYKHS
jgi:hypothetical protein